MNIAQIEKNLQKMMKSYSKETFIYQLFSAYGLPKASITRLKKGNLNLSKVKGEISWKKKVLFKEVFNADLHIAVTGAAKQLKLGERFVIVTDYKTLLAIDTKTHDKLDIDLADLPKHYDFFLPWAGMEKAHHQNENPADVKAAEKMAKMFDEIKRDNPNDDPEFIHGLNVFLSRLLFCFFAEDTNIFNEGIFTDGISSHTQSDGSDLNTYFDNLFEVLNTPEKGRIGLATHYDVFPYVNGGLFRQKIVSPIFTRRSRQAIIDGGELNWSDINPDIFGSMMQAVVTPEHRGGLGMHYTSVPNIMKVIEPLFLNDLNIEFEKSKSNPKKLNELLLRLSKIKIFDPACGSGNFLIIAYKVLRRLEILIINHLLKLQKIAQGFNQQAEQLELIPKSQLSLAASYQIHLFSIIQLNQFYGIELDDFAHEIAQLSLWLAEHQMNEEFFIEFGQTNPTLPLKEAGQIRNGNACRIKWETVCPKSQEDEVYILGNPPYLGYAKQTEDQKEDMAEVFKTVSGYKKLDYIGCWFYKGAEYIGSSKSKYCFVTTNSLTQGEQVSLLWPNIFKRGLEIGFAYQSFKWKNNAKSNAGVTVVVIGIQKKTDSLKRLFSDSTYHEVNSINPYLIPTGKTIVNNRYSPLSHIPIMIKGCSPGDNGNLLMTPKEKDRLVESDNRIAKYLKKYIGADEFLNNELRYCIWIEADDYEVAKSIPVLRERFDKVEKFRQKSKKAGTRKKANTPYAFDEKKYKKSNAIIFPQTTSENRPYIPIGFLDSSFVVSNAARLVYDAKPWLFGLLTSKMHNVWLQTVAGRLETRIQYSNTLCYNSFPFPKITDQRKKEIPKCVFNILEEREKHSEKTLAQLYNPDKMPDDLRKAHMQNDFAIERCYRSKPFESDEERLKFLFKLYEKMIEEEQNNGSLFEKPKKTRKKK
jgi:hypothetical protein